MRFVSVCSLRLDEVVSFVFVFVYCREMFKFRYLLAQLVLQQRSGNKEQ